ncbi:TolB family protein [Micromonospora sp. CPCC 205714]|uniref:TolB family protein n=1 Tax=Micromonospora sp. CPCC 205714 TaxID=3122402 RepID=UPI002FF15891
MAVLAGMPLLLPALPDAGPAPGTANRPVVPSRVYPPMTGEATVLEDPPGPAALVVAGDQELRGSDIWGWEGRSLVVGRDGSYRLARTVGETTAGTEDLLLSPDGRRLAAQPWLEGSRWPDDPIGQTAILDLNTGQARQYAGGLPVVWAPDGRRLLVMAQSIDGRLGRLSLLDPATAALHQLPQITGTFRPGNLAAFSPDGSRLAVATTHALHIIDLASGTTRTLGALTWRDRLAGPGAWLPDGDRIAIWSIGDCEDGGSCDEGRLARRSIHISYWYARTGAPAIGPTLPPARGLAARLLGWQRDGDAVVAEYQPEKGLAKRPDDQLWSETGWTQVGAVTLREFRPDGSRPELVELPSSALFVDVPADLLDSFGGPSPSWPEGAARWLLAVWWPLGQFLVALVGLTALVASRRMVARRRQTRLRGRS